MVHLHTYVQLMVSCIFVFQLYRLCCLLLERLALVWSSFSFRLICTLLQRCWRPALVSLTFCWLSWSWGNSLTQCNPTNNSFLSTSVFQNIYVFIFREHFVDDNGRYIRSINYTPEGVHLLFHYFICLLVYVNSTVYKYVCICIFVVCVVFIKTYLFFPQIKYLWLLRWKVILTRSQCSPPTFFSLSFSLFLQCLKRKWSSIIFYDKPLI